MLSKKTKYAIHALVYLAKQFAQGPILISQIAASEKIPQKFLETILLELKNAGILASKKGKGGGYYLLKKPEQVNIAEIVRLFDGPIGLIPCVTHKYYEHCEECKDEQTCGVRNIFTELRNATVTMLKANTLAEVLRREDKLRKTKV